MMPILPLIYAFINLIILFFVLYIALRKTTTKALVERRESFLTKSKEAGAFYKESSEKYGSIKNKIENIESDGASFMNETLKIANINGDKIIEDAKKISNLMMDDATHMAGVEIKQARNRIRARFVAKIIDEAQIKLKSKVDDSRRGEYIDEYSKAVKFEVIR